MRDRDQKAAEDRHIGFRWFAREAGLADEADAEIVFLTVGRELAERIGPEEARHLASHLPLGLREDWERETATVAAPRRFDLDEFTASVQDRLGLDRPEDAVWLTEAVFAWLNHLAPEERAVLLHLPVPRKLRVRHPPPA